MIHALRPSLVDMEHVCRRPNRENLTEAFLLAEIELGIPQLLDPDGKPFENINKNNAVKIKIAMLRGQH